jgi:hypothetical protein
MDAQPQGASRRELGRAIGACAPQPKAPRAKRGRSSNGRSRGWLRRHRHEAKTLHRGQHLSSIYRVGWVRWSPRSSPAGMDAESLPHASEAAGRRANKRRSARAPRRNEARADALHASADSAGAGGLACRRARPLARARVGSETAFERRYRIEAWVSHDPGPHSRRSHQIRDISTRAASNKERP